MEPDLIPYQASTGIAARAVIVVAPHADDEVFGCGGAVALHIQAGVRVHTIILTSDSDASTAQDRAAESRAAAMRLGQDKPDSLDFWDLPDRGLVNEPSLVQRLCERIGETGADLVYAPSPFEVHPDHRQTAGIAAAAVARMGGPLRLAFYEVGSPLRPNLLVDITPVLDRKQSAMGSFVTQLAQQDYLRHINALNTYRTYTLPPEVKSAEAFWMVTAQDIAAGLISPCTLPTVSPGVIPSDALKSRDELPMVSVLVRSMDRPWLSEALDSIALQTYPNIEVVVVSATPGHSQLPQYCGPYPMRLVTTDQPLARSAAANQALKAARGEWLLLLDDDDWLLPAHVDRLARLLHQQPGARAAYAGVELVDSTRRPIGQTLDLPWDRVRQRAGNLTPIHAVLFDASLVRTGGCLFDPHLDHLEDWDFWLQIAQQTTPVHLPGISAVYRVHDSSGIHEDAGPRGRAAAAVYEKWEPFWTAADKGAIMERVWSEPDTEHALLQTRAQVAQLQAALAAVHASHGRSAMVRQAQAQAEAHALALHDKDVHIGNLDMVIASERSALQAKQLYIEGLQAATASQIEGLQELVATQRQSLHDKDVHIGNLDAQIGNMDAQISNLVTQLANTQLVLNARDERVLHLEAQLRSTAAQLAQASSEIEAMKNSRAWRLTRPLRAAATLLRRVRSRISGIEGSNLK